MTQWDDKMHFFFFFDETASLQAVQNIVLPIINNYSTRARWISNDR